MSGLVVRVSTFAIAAVIVTMTAASRVFSCSCIPTPTPGQAFQEAEAVLMGKVIAIRDGPGPYLVTATLHVSNTWKGKRGSFQEIVTTSDLGAMCGFYFQEGKSYVIYAYKNQDGLLETNNCTRSASTERASADLLYLSSLPIAANDAACCGSKNILAGDLYLFVGLIVFLLKRKPSRQSSSFDVNA